MRSVGPDTGRTFFVRGNLFVVSRVGQLRNVQSFIAEHDATHNHLAVLQTESNPVLSDNIRRNVDKGVFETVEYIDQPPRPVTQSRRKNAIIYDQIDKLLLRATGEHDVGSLFLCNADNYYSLFERINTTRSLGLSLNLLEEGLTTYSNAGRRVYALDTSVDWAEVKTRGRHFRLALVKAARSLAALLVTFASWVLRVDMVQVLKDLWVRLFVREQHRYGAIKHFDSAYVYFPDKIYSANVQIDRVGKLSFVLESTVAPELLETVEPGAVVFVSQRYIPYEEYFSIVFEILSEMGLEKVYFKFHPREDPASLAKAWDLAQREHPRLNVVSPPEIRAIPVEELMMSGRARQIIGLTSTSLMYGKAFFPGVDVVSIGARFKELADSDAYDVSKRALAEFTRDLEVFCDVSDVRQF